MVRIGINTMFNQIIVGRSGLNLLGYLLFFDNLILSSVLQGSHVFPHCKDTVTHCADSKKVLTRQTEIGSFIVCVI